MQNNIKRVEWFAKGYVILRRDLLEEAPPSATIVVGFPVKKRSGNTMTIGECHHGCMKGAGPEFGEENLIVIHPILLDRPIDALATLLHEMIHAALGPDVKAHGKEFQALAKRCGLQPPWTATTPDATLSEYLLGVANELGSLPPGVYTPPPPKPRKPSSLKKYHCGCAKPRVLTLSPSKLQAGPLICGVCKQSFRTEQQHELAGTAADDEF